MRKIYLSLALVVVSASVNAQTNLIPNNGFESWTGLVPDSWFVTGSTVAKSTSVKKSGSNSIGLTSPASGNKTISPTTDTPVTAGVTYVFSGWYLDNSPTARFRFWNQFRTSSSDTGTNNLQAADYSTDSSSWQLFIAEGVPNPTAIQARPGLRIYPETSTSGGGVIYFDDIMFYDKSTLSVRNVEDFDNQINMNTIISDVLRIQMPTRATVNIYSLEGRLISSNRVDSNEVVNTQSLTSGVYLVTIQNEYAKTSRKVIKN